MRGWTAEGWLEGRLTGSWVLLVVLVVLVVLMVLVVLVLVLVLVLVDDIDVEIVKLLGGCAVGFGV